MTLDKAASLGRKLGKIATQQEEVVKGNISPDETDAQLLINNTESITVDERLIVSKLVPATDAIRFDLDNAFTWDDSTYAFDSFYNEALTETLYSFNTDW